MQKIGVLKRAAILAVALFISVPAFGQGFAQSVVRETQEGANTELNAINDSSNDTFGEPFNIVAFAVRSFDGGDDPTTTQPGWTAEALDAALWLQPMGGSGSMLPTWEAYTGITYTNAFPSDPAEVNAYVTTPGSASIITPGSSLNGFFFQGVPDADDHFLLVKGHGQVIIEGETQTVRGTVQVVPEPASANLCLLAAACFGFFGAKIKFFAEKIFKPGRRRDQFLTGFCFDLNHRPARTENSPARKSNRFTSP